MERYIRKFTVVLIEKINDELYLVTDGKKEYYIDRETFEKDYEPL
jgi:hypothetical protein